MADAPAPAGEVAPEYWQVTLGRVVELYGFHYKPGFLHTVDTATLEALGDAVLMKTPFKG